MTGFILAPEAVEDVFEIWQYLHRREGLELANRVENELYDDFARLADMPGQGHARSDLTSHAVLFFALYANMIVYRPEQPLEIVRMLHGKRELKRVLE
jgi:plasmid stabilization system protein ParE